MFFSILLFIFLLYSMEEKSFFKILIIAFVAIYHLIASAFIAKNLGLVRINASLIRYQSKYFSWKVFLLSGLIFLIIFLVVKIIKKFINRNKEQINGKILIGRETIASLVISILIFLGVFIYSSALWVKEFFGNVGIEEMLYTITQPLRGTDEGQILSFIYGPVLDSLFITFTFICVLQLLNILFSNYVPIKIRSNFFVKNTKRLFLGIISIAILFLGMILGVQEIGYADIKAYFFEKTNLYEDYFVDPTETKLIFPEEKRNLIYIFVESLEVTYLSKELGGVEEINLLPNLSVLAENEISFSHDENLGGALNVRGTGFTVGAMVGQTAGVPLKVVGTYSENEYGKTSSFMPGLTSLGDILEKEGYNQTLFIGSDAGFAGRDKYFSQHGNYSIEDYNYAQKAGWIPEDYKVWWGYEDEKLFPLAKKRLTEIADSNEPFNFTLLTADTHFPDGYMGPNTPELFENQYSNVIHYSDQMLIEFIEWIQEQPFYENTTVVLTGDHLSMDRNYFTDLDSNYQRTIFNVFLNTPLKPSKTKNRLFSSLDMFPTTLALLGVEIEGNRLGLGTNLFSNEETLIEEIGYSFFTEEIKKSSLYYNMKIMQGSDLEVGKDKN